MYNIVKLTLCLECENVSLDASVQSSKLSRSQQRTASEQAINRFTPIFKTKAKTIAFIYLSKAKILFGLKDGFESIGKID
jgi:hypothetical protein